jgi:hypothetical protein
MLVRTKEEDDEMKGGLGGLQGPVGPVFFSSPFFPRNCFFFSLLKLLGIRGGLERFGNTFKPNFKTCVIVSK